MENGMIYYFILINIIAVYMMYADKKRAVQKQYRIKEATLWSIAVIGGAIGATFGMKQFRHKTKHLNFKYGLPFLAIIQIIFLIYFVQQ